MERDRKAFGDSPHACRLSGPRRCDDVVVTERLSRHSDETTSDLSDSPPRLPARLGRRAGVAVLVVIVLAAAFDVLGPRSSETSARGAEYALDLEYPLIARAGEPAPLIVTITADGSFGDTVRVRFCAEYFEHLDFQSWYPSPSGETSDPDWIVYQFDKPATGQSLRVALDARMAPGQLGGRDACEVSVLEQDEPVVTAAWTTWRAP